MRLVSTSSILLLLVALVLMLLSSLVLDALSQRQEVDQATGEVVAESGHGYGHGRHW